MKNNTHFVRQVILCCVSAVLTVLLICLTFIDPAKIPFAPLMVHMLLMPGLLLLSAGVNFGCLRMGVRALCAGRPDRHSAALLAVILTAALCALGIYPAAMAGASLLLTMSALLDLLENRLEAAMPGAKDSKTAGATLWGWCGLAAPVCAAIIWGILGAGPGDILARSLCILLAGALCPLRLIMLLTSRSAFCSLRVPADSMQTIASLGTAGTILLSPDGLLTASLSVAEIQPAGMEENQFLTLAASILQGDSPEAETVAAEAQGRGLQAMPAEKYTQSADGFSAILNGKRYFAGTPEQLRARGILAPRADAVQLAGKLAICFGMEGGMYLGLLSLRPALRLDAQEAIQALRAQHVKVLLPAGSQPLFTRQIAGRVGADVSARAEPGNAVCLSFGEPCAAMHNQSALLSLRALSDAPEVFRICRRAVHSQRLLCVLSAACGVMLCCAAGGVLAPALDLGAQPLLCALLGLLAAGIVSAPAAFGTRKTRPIPQPEPAEPEPESEPEQPQPRTVTIRMDELAAVPGKAALEQALLDIPGVRTVEADYESGLILVTGTTEKEPLLRAIIEAASE